MLLLAMNNEKITNFVKARIVSDRTKAHIFRNFGGWGRKGTQPAADCTFRCVVASLMKYTVHMFITKKFMHCDVK